ncbi:MAG: hypothetical protein ACPHER_05445 [Nevskiales bacterium]
MQAQPQTTSQWLDQMERAIADEHAALASSQAEQLMDAVKRKEQAAAALEQLAETERALLDEERLAQLQAANQANAALMQVAYMHAQWALEQLGRLDKQSVYTADGNSQPATITQYIGTA